MGVLRWTLAAAAISGALLAVAPASASAKASCIFDDLKASERNRDEVERSLFCLTNLHRIRSGLDAVEIDTRLMDVARTHTVDMIARGFYSHINPDGAGPAARAVAGGYSSPVGENLATNLEGTAAMLFDQWLNSPSHNENMLFPHYQAAGVGVDHRCCPGSGGHPGVTGTQIFGTGAANTGDDALDFYASSNSCAKAKESLFRKRRAKKRARGARKRRLADRIPVLNKEVDKRCKEL